MKIVTLTDEDYGLILGVLFQHNLDGVFRANVRSEERVTNFPYFTQGGVVTSPREHSPHHVQHSLPPRGEPTTPPLPPVIRAKPANRDMWGHAT